MIYTPIQVPNIEVFNNPTKASSEDVKFFFQWFIDNRDQRISVLQKAVKSTFGYELWEADLTKESVGVLGRWFSEVAVLRLRNEKEIQEEVSKIQPKFAFLNDSITSSRVYDSQTVSIAFDIGIYFGEVLRNIHKKLYWLIMPDKNYFGYNHPVLGIFKNGYYNPRIMENIYEKVVEDPNHLSRLLDTWLRLV